MTAMPVYLKQSEQETRPTDSEFYWVTRDGTFLCRNHPFFESDVPTSQPPRALAPHRARCILRYPKLGRRMLETIVGFFDLVYRRHQAESVVLLYWDLQEERYRLHIPRQEAKVWQSWNGHRVPTDVSYTVPLDVPPNCLLVGDIHCHGDMASYTSYTDQNDARYRDGIHAVVGQIQQEPPQFHTEISIDGYAFLVRFEDFFAGYRSRRAAPEQWLQRVSVITQYSTWQPPAPVGGNGRDKKGFLRPPASDFPHGSQA